MKCCQSANFLLFLFLVSCAFYPGEISPPYKSRVEALLKQLTDDPYSIHIVENHYTIAQIDLRTRWILLDAKSAEFFLRENPNILRVLLAHEIAHDKLGHRYASVPDKRAIQELEFEADEEALNLLHKRGHNLWDYWRAMRVLKEIEDKNPSGFYEQFYSSHPYSGERLEKIEKKIATLSPGLAKPKDLYEAGRIPVKPSLIREQIRLEAYKKVSDLSREYNLNYRTKRQYADALVRSMDDFQDLQDVPLTRQESTLINFTKIIIRRWGRGEISEKEAGELLAQKDKEIQARIKYAEKCGIYVVVGPIPNACN